MLRLARFAFWAAALFAFAMAVVPHPPAIPVWDKLQHMAAFFVITVLGCVSYPRFSRLTLAAALVAFGGFIEIVQMIPMLHRDSDVRDWIADIFAVLIALACVSLARRLGAAQAD